MGVRFVFLLLLGLLSLLARPAAAQGFDPRSAVPPDSLHTDAAERINQPDSLRRQFDQQRMLNRLKAYTRRKTLAGRAASALFNFSRPQEETAGLDAALLDRQFDRHIFKIVRHVTITPYDAFGYSLTDSTRHPRTLIEKSGNVLHIRTARSRIRQVLLFRIGQPLEPQALAESERLLRQTPEILDARVLVNEHTTTRDSVDIDVLTTDVFSITGGLEVGGPTFGTATLGDDNFLGLGHQIENSYEYGRTLTQVTPDPVQTWRYDGSYRVPFRHFFVAQGRYSNQYLNETGSATLQRDFYSVNTRYAGALNLNYNNVRALVEAPPPGEQPNYVPLRYQSQDLWVGRALHLRSYDLGYENPGRIILAARVSRTEFTTKPNDTFRTTTALLGTVGYSVRHYYKDRYLFGFGRTEDIPTGTLLSFTAGFDANPTVPRRYISSRLASALYSPRHGYIYGSVEFGSFQRLEDHSVWEQGLLSTQSTYFTRLYRLGNWQYRHFLSSRGTIGFNRRPGEVLMGINGERGLRGFSSAQPIQATSRFVASYETTVFTPVSLFGFRVAGVAFADMAWVTERPGGGTPFGNTPYSGFGLGLRLRNEYTALRTFQILLGYYPRGLTDPNGFRIFESARETVTFTDFGLGSPSTGIYQ